MRAGAEVQPLLTESGERMVSRATFAALTGRRVPATVHDLAGVEHVALARWGQVLVIAPATAHLLARLAAGLADDLLTNVALASAGRSGRPGHAHRDVGAPGHPPTFRPWRGAGSGSWPRPRGR